MLCLPEDSCPIYWVKTHSITTHRSGTCLPPYFTKSPGRLCAVTAVQCRGNQTLIMLIWYRCKTISETGYSHQMNCPWLSLLISWLYLVLCESQRCSCLCPAGKATTQVNARTSTHEGSKQTRCLIHRQCNRAAISSSQVRQKVKGIPRQLFPGLC